MSLKEIANRCGTSVATVSRVLNTPGYHCHKKGLEEKIWAAAEELHYTPNAYAKSLRMGHKTKSVPLTIDILLTRFDSMDKDDFFLELFEYTKKELLENDCVLGDVLTVPDMAALAAKEQKAKQVPYRSSKKITAEQGTNSALFVSQKPHAGLLIFGKCPADMIPVLKKRYAYLVGIDRNPTDYQYDEVICNGVTAAEKAVDHLISLGHKNIAYIGDCTYEARYIGFYQALLNHKIPLRYENVYQTTQTKEEGRKMMLEILKKPEKPTAIFCANDCTAIGVLQALAKNRRKGYMPSVISIDNIDAAQKTSPMLTTIHIPKQEMVHLALMLLLDQKKGHHKENVRIELPCHLIERESCFYFHS